MRDRWHRLLDELNRRWRIFYRYWCDHEWAYDERRQKRTCPRCGQHDWYVPKRRGRNGDPTAWAWVKMNWDEMRG